MSQGDPGSAQLRRTLQQLQSQAATMVQLTRLWHDQAIEFQRALGQVEGDMLQPDQTDMGARPIRQIQAPSTE